MTGYIRTDTTDKIANGNTVDAIPLDAEFNAIQTAFDAVGGHNHDGTVGEGAPILVLGPAQDVVVSDNSITPKTDNIVDLGSTTLEFKDLWIDGVANIDSLVADTADINAGTIDATVIGATTPAAATVTTLAATTATVGADTVTTNTAVQTLTNKTINLTNNTLVATSAQVAAAVTDETGTGALVFADSPALTGVPTAPTAAAATNTTQVATTAHVFAERSNAATLTNKTLTSPTISGGTITGITDLAIADGGTGASTAAAALTNFGISATAAELSVLSGIPIGLTATELGYMDGVTSSVQTQLDAKQASDATLTALAAYNANGLITQTAADTFAGRSVAGTASQISVTNGDGVAGNPTISAVIASQAQAEAGADNTSLMTALRTAQAIAALGSATGTNLQVFTVSGTYTPTTGYKKALIVCTGGGQGGQNSTATNGDCGFGGQGGATAFALSDISSGAAQTVTIGAAGASNLGNGGTTSVGTLCSATGGGAVYAVTGALGIQGAEGGSDVDAGSNYGGSSFWGGGPRGATGNGVVGRNATVYGTGGGGASSSGAAQAGGVGMTGVAFILEFK